MWKNVQRYNESIRSLQHKVTVKVAVGHLCISGHYVKATTSVKLSKNVYVFQHEDSDTEPVHMGETVFISSYAVS